nr:DNA polymerase IV [Paracoccaceae bacterium]
NETTFGRDLAAFDDLKPILWDLAGTVSARLRAGLLSGRPITLKLKRADHRVLTRRQTLGAATRMADTLYRTGLPLLQREMAAGPFRLLGLGVSDIVHSPADSEGPDLLDPHQSRRFAAETAADAIRNRFGAGAIILGRSLR